MVELALILPIMVLFLALSADFGRALTAYIQIGSAAREGAAYGMQSSGLSTSDIEFAAYQELDSSLNPGQRPTIWGTEPEARVIPCTDGMTGPGPENLPYQCVAVEMSYNFSPFITIGPIPENIPMQRTVEMRVVN